MQDGPVGDGSPLPVGDAVDAGRRFVRGNDRRILEFGLDPATQLIQRFGHPGEGIGNRTLGDRYPEQLGKKPAQPLKANMVAVVQIKQQRMNVRPKGGANRHVIRRQGLKTFAAMAAATAKKLDPDDFRGQQRDLHPIITMTVGLTLARHIAAAVLAGYCRLLHHPTRMLSQTAAATGTRRPDPLGLGLGRLPF